ncbi:hypothetical protein BGX38DRAFT_1205498 [Terfezia claveryi]|nr:hypothetical protein BGX38DRAFT_1205498 [Terfezia claveryi]
MPSVKEEGDNDSRYSQWRGGIKAWARTNHVVGKRQAGTALWKTFRDYALAEAGLPASGKRLLQNGAAAIKKEAEKALDKLLQDTLKKLRDTERTHALSQVVSLASDTPDIQYTPNDNAVTSGQNTDNESGNWGFRKSVRIFLVDSGREDEVRVTPGGAYKWDGCPSHYVAIMQVASLLEVVDKVRDKIPVGRTVRAIFGALENPRLPNTIPDATRLQSDEEPIRLQVVLLRNPVAVPSKADSPPPDDGAYFPGDLLDAAEQYNDPGEDSETLCRNLASYSKRTMPRKDEAFEDRKMAARRRLRKVRDEGLDPEYIAALNPQPANGREMIEARAAGLAGGLAYDAVMDGMREHNPGMRQRATAAGHAAAATTWSQRP